MADAVEMLDHRHPRFGRDALDQAAAATRHDDIDELRHGDQITDGGAVGGVEDLHRRLRQAGDGQAFAHAGGDGLIRGERFPPASEDCGVTRFQAQRRGVRRDVGPRFVDDADHAQRHAHLADLDAGRPALQIRDVTDRVRQGRDLFQPLRHGLDPAGRERQAIDHGRVQAL